jgi:GNAT superfamily N-acetyltransferase
VSTDRVVIRQLQSDDFEAVSAMTRRVYPGVVPWTHVQLRSHLRIFPEGQLVAVDTTNDNIVGMAASLVILWDDYHMYLGWKDFTDAGMFTNHDPFRGRTLYGAEVMVDPGMQGHGVGSKLYVARRQLAEGMGLLRIRAGARLRDYHTHAATLSPQEYVQKIVSGELGDRTLSFQLRRGFKVIEVVRGYLQHDPESLGYAAVIEWLNRAVATPEELAEHEASQMRG